MNNLIAINLTTIGKSPTSAFQHTINFVLNGGGAANLGFRQNRRALQRHKSRQSEH